MNLCAYLLDARLAEGRGSRAAVRTGNGTFSYDAVARLSSRYARRLLADGVSRGDRVIVTLPDGLAFVGALFGILRIGAVAVMVNPDAPADLVEHIVEIAGARVSLDAVDDDRAAAPDADASEAFLAPVESHRDDPAIWLFSGGTTGWPKAVVQTHGSFINTTELYGQRVLGLRPDDVTISVPKLFFGYATGSNLFFPFSVGASCVLFPERCTADTLFEQIRRHRPTVLVNVPAMIQQMLAHPAAAPQDLSSLRLATSAGEALPAEMHERWTGTFGVELLDGLGTAEMWHIFISNRPGDVVPGTLGRVVPGFDVKLCDDDGTSVPDGEVGVLWVRGDSRSPGYWQQPEETARAFRGEWYISGDMLRRRPDGTFVYCGRSDDMLKVNGKWLAPGELENCLVSHPAVREAAVIGARNDAGLIKPYAFVVPDRKSDSLAHELQEYAKAALEPYKYPRRIVFVDALPRTHLGKVDRAALKAHPALQRA